ncbi:MAG: endonuclease [Flavobacteriales bacterium]
MKKTLILSTALLSLASIAQPLNYYNSANGLTGTALKSALHDIIDDHTELEYGTIKTVIRQADEDPNNSNNIILLYTGNSISKWDFASDPSNPDHVDFWNREHVWAKSHGNFGPTGLYTEKGANTDAHHLRPSDMTINSARGYKDFDNGGSVVNNGSTPTDCKSTTNTWEPRDEVKGDVARMIFYMATRYEGGTSLAGDNEPDLEVVDNVGTFPLPQMGKLSTLLAWHAQDPVDEFELNRNDVIFNWQGNRNPFIDHPEFVEMVFGTDAAYADEWSNLAINPVLPTQGDVINVSATLAGTASTPTLFWGNDWASVLDSTNTVAMTDDGSGNYSASIPSQVYSAKVYFRIKNGNSAFISHNFKIQPEPFTGTITSIPTVQGTGAISPLAYQVTDASGTQTNSANNVEISVSGTVTAAFGDNFFIQESQELRSGMYIYSSGFFPAIGDSVIVTGKVKEYYNMTEIVNVSGLHTISTGLQLPDFTVVTANDISNSNPTTAEDYESMLIKVFNAGCTDDDLGFGMWEITDATGSCNIHNSATYNYNPTVGTAYNVSGVLNFNFDEFKVELRFSEDVEAGTDNVAPTIEDASSSVNGFVTVIFSEDITTATIEDISNYSINNGVVVTGATQHSFQNNRVDLTVDNLGTGMHTITITGCLDNAGNVVDDSFDFNSTSNNVSVNELDGNSIYAVVKNGNVSLSHIKENSTVRVSNLLGQVVYSEKAVNAKNLSINLDNGYYTIEIENMGEVQTLKVILK